MRRAAQLLAVLCVVALVAAAAVGGGKKPPGGEDPGTGGGTIYFWSWISGVGQVWSMNSDGSSKTALPVYRYYGVTSGAEPSCLLHDDAEGVPHRWFLQLQEVTPEPDEPPPYEYEIFAVRDDGLTVQLTFDPSLEELPGNTTGCLRWSLGDTRLSWRARYRDPHTGTLIAGGIYSMAIGFGADGIPAPIGGPILEVVGTWVDDQYWGLVPDCQEHDWSPDGTAVVLDHYAGGLSIVDFSTGESWELVPNGYSPDWSPDGGKIVFQLFPNTETINPDGSDRRVVLTNTHARYSWSVHYLHPQWSPTGSHLAITRDRTNYHKLTRTMDVCRAEADGSDLRNLTNDIADAVGALAWR